MAVRVTGLLMAHDLSLKREMQQEASHLLDALLELINFCRNTKRPNNDTRIIRVNCCVVISMIMQGKREEERLRNHRVFW